MGTPPPLARGGHSVSGVILFGALPLLTFLGIFIPQVLGGAGLVGSLEARQSPFEQLGAPPPEAAQVKTAGVRVPAHYLVTEQTDTGLVLRRPGGDRGLYVEAHRVQKPPVFAGAEAISFIGRLLGDHPDGRQCRDQSSLTLQGVAGVQFAVCYRVTRADGSTYPSVDYYWFGTGSDGAVFYEVEAWTSLWQWFGFMSEARGAVAGVTWTI